MNTPLQINNLKKALILALLAIYVFFSWVFILILPAANHGYLATATISQVKTFHKNNHETANLPRGMRSVIEHKQKTVVPANVVCILFFSFIFGALQLWSLAAKYNFYYTPFYFTRLHTYLTLRRFLI